MRLSGPCKDTAAREVWPIHNHGEPPPLQSSNMPRTFKAIPESVDSPSGDLATELGLPARGRDTPRLIIGRREWLALPDLGVSPLYAKTDSGARSSSLHAENIVLSADKQSVRFTTYNHTGNAIECEAAVVRFGRVRSSSGFARTRIFIQTHAVLCGGFRWPILLSLANRSDMACPILLGRRALAGYFLIDPQGTHLLGLRRHLEIEFRSSRPSVRPERSATAKALGAISRALIPAKDPVVKQDPSQKARQRPPSPPLHG